MNEAPGIERDIGKFAERNVAIGAGRRRIGDLDVANRVDAAAVFGVEPDGEVELPVTFQDRGRRGAAERCLNDGVDVAGIEAVARGLFAIDLDIEIRLSQEVEDSEIGHAADLRHLVHHLGREPLQNLEILPDDLHGIGALHARKRLLDIVLDVLREIEADAGQFLRELLLQFLRQLFLGQVRRPLVERLERREQLDVGERRCVAAIVRPAMLRHNREDLRMAQQDLAHFAGDRCAGIERHRRWHRRPDPEIALLQCRQELAAEARCRQTADTKENNPDDHGDR